VSTCYIIRVNIGGRRKEGFFWSGSVLNIYHV
jgi:hypothetical protein